MDMAALEDAMQDQSPSNSVHSNQELESHHDTPMSASSMELENRLLKNEIASLNQEMTSLVQRAKDSETGTQGLKKKIFVLDNLTLPSKTLPTLKFFWWFQNVYFENGEKSVKLVDFHNFLKKKQQQKNFQPIISTVSFI